MTYKHIGHGLDDKVKAEVFVKPILAKADIWSAGGLQEKKTLSNPCRCVCNFEKMNVGDTLTISGEFPPCFVPLNCAQAFGDSQGWKFEGAVGDGVIRIWRVS